jgi:transcriptional regulator with PAS, ATPase and Fis domain
VTLAASERGGKFAEQVTTRIGEWEKRDSPIKAILDKDTFDFIHLLSHYGTEIDQGYGQWMGRPVKFHEYEAPNPEDYGRIFQITDEVLSHIAKEHGKEIMDLHINLSSGTHAMVATLLLLGNTNYRATFYTTYKSKASIVTLPFDVELFIHEQFEKPDQTWARTAFRSVDKEQNFSSIVGESDGISKAMSLARRAASRNVNILLLGESGVGKELFAKAIHKSSGRKGKFIPFNCAAIPTELLEAELFGAVKGAATGVVAREGYFKEADGGTLFLDEVGELAPQHQAKLLRVFSSADMTQSPTLLKIEKVGAPGNPSEVDVRIIAATNRDLLSDKRPDHFRSDLYYRLSTFPILIPPLRERGNDIKIIAQKLIERINQQFSKSEPGFEPRKLSAAATRRLKQNSWPGNVRELNAVLTRAVIMSKDLELGRQDIEEVIAEVISDEKHDVFSRVREPGFKLEDRLRQIEKAFIEDVLQDTDGNQRKAAEILGVHAATLNKKIHSLEIVIE